MGIPLRQFIIGAAIAAFVCGSIIAGLVASEAIDVNGWYYYYDIVGGTWLAIGTMVPVFVLLLILVFLLGPVIAWWISMISRQGGASRRDVPSTEIDHLEQQD